MGAKSQEQGIAGRYYVANLWAGMVVKKIEEHEEIYLMLS